jgi:7-cyano-7-deazaguanine reductase
MMGYSTRESSSSFSLRKHDTFHEEVVNRILDDVVKAIKLRQAEVKGVFNPRGGIGITVEAEYPEIRQR